MYEMVKTHLVSEIDLIKRNDIGLESSSGGPFCQLMALGDCSCKPILSLV